MKEIIAEIKRAKMLSTESEIESADNDSLLRGLLTPDGRGSEFKLKLLVEIENRIRMDELTIELP